MKTDPASPILLSQALSPATGLCCEGLGAWVLGRKTTNLDSVLKSRDITLLTKLHLVTAMVFLVVVYGCESWTIKKAEHRRIDAFELVLDKTLEHPLGIKEIKPVNPKGNQPWIFTWRTDAELQYFGHLMQRADSLEKIAGKIEGEKRRGRQSLRWLDGITDSMEMSLSKL